MTSSARRPWWPVIVAIICFSALAVYATSFSLYARDTTTGVIYRDQSLNDYRHALEGTAAYPSQWRLAGIYLVRAGERLTGADPHAIDLTVKMIFLSASSLILFLFTRAYASESGALAAVAIYLIATIVGFGSAGYSIYFTSDYVMIATWFAAVWLLREDRWRAAALVTLVGSLAKETMLLVPILAGLRFMRGRARLGDVFAIGVAFLVPTIVLRWVYVAPLSKWAWWDMMFVNVPFLQSNAPALLATLRSNLKVLLLFNVLWLVAAMAIIRSSDTFRRDLGLTAISYLLLAYPVIAIRELRHFLLLAIVVLPSAVAAIETRSMSATTATAMNPNTKG